MAWFKSTGGDTCVFSAAGWTVNLVALSLRLPEQLAGCTRREEAPAAQPGTLPL